VADGDVSVDSDEHGRPDGGRVGEVGQRKNKDDDERLEVLLVQSDAQSAELHHRLDAVQRKRRHQQQVVHHRNALCSVAASIRSIVLENSCVLI